jgi:hypothetical protein
MPTDQPIQPTQNLRWFHFTPGRMLIVLLAVERILLLCNWFHWITKGWAVLIAIAVEGAFLLLMLLWLVLALFFHWRFQPPIRPADLFRGVRSKLIGSVET